MCGRVNVSDHAGVQRLLDFLDIPLNPEQFVPRYNIAPGAPLFTAYFPENSPAGAFMDWGIIPVWAKPGKFNRPLINARAETIWEKPSFKNLVKNQRVIVPINGFYEWRRENNHKTAFHIQGDGETPLALGGIYQISKEGILQCCLVTTAANSAMSKVHDRMPVIINPDAMQDWLQTNDRAQLDSLMRPIPDNAIEFTEVSSYVNNAQHDDEQCIAPIKKQSDLFSSDD